MPEKIKKSGKARFVGNQASPNDYVKVFVEKKRCSSGELLVDKSTSFQRMKTSTTKMPPSSFIPA